MFKSGMRCLLLCMLLFNIGAACWATANHDTSADVQPLTGMVLWHDSDVALEHPDAIQLEFAYVGYDQVAKAGGKFDWSYVESILNKASARHHQVILRFYDTYPGKSTTVPNFIKKSSGYHETRGVSEGLPTQFPDWSNQNYQKFVTDFIKAFSARYDKDPRVAYLQFGFGLWSEYHIYDGPFELGKTFPDLKTQSRLLKTANDAFKELRWSISIDSASEEIGPFAADKDLLKLRFGVFDDSFMAKEHDQVNRLNHLALGVNRFKLNPVGGEISYYTELDQRLALSEKGVYGRTFKAMAARYHLTYMLGNDQPEYQTIGRIKSVGSQMGYRFKLKSVSEKNGKTWVTIQNTGIAPIYYPAYVAIGDAKSSDSLVSLMPGEVKSYVVNGTVSPQNPLHIFCSHILKTQHMTLEE